jgi:hypothetical protein
MTRNQKLIALGAILIGVGVFVTSDFSRKPTSGGEDENFGGDCGCDPNADPYMMLEVDQKAFPNFDGSQDMVIAKNNYPLGRILEIAKWLVLARSLFIVLIDGGHNENY